MAKSEDVFNYEEMIHKKRLPILILDSRWQQLFSDDQKPANIKKLEENLMSAIKKQAKLGTELKELQKLKKKLMKEIVLNMEEVSADEKESKRKKKLDKTQKLIIDINDKIQRCLQETDDIPDRIKEANEALMIASVRVCYERMHKNEADIKAITEWLDRTRIELKRQVLVKQDKEETNSKIYSYLHDIMGPEFMELFDRNDGNI